MPSHESPGEIGVAEEIVSFCLQKVTRDNARNTHSLTSGGSRIFLSGGANSQNEIIFFNFLLKTAWKWKNLGTGGGRASLAPPLRSANAYMFTLVNS